jgi:hypothetical protein
MTLTIPVWLLWAVGGLAAIAVLLLAVVGVLAIIYVPKMMPRYR